MSLIRLSSKTGLNYVALVPSRSEGKLPPGVCGTSGMNSGRLLRTLWPCVLLAIMVAPSVREEGTIDNPSGAHLNIVHLAMAGTFINNDVVTVKIHTAIELIRKH